ncbi:hypothetical protein QJS10_CPB17g01043 [Acorus calamus]|uniref:Uncharacterized protein n=1 Tax=Acorus calamus TaxID=4465 RepID=A0AAV9CZ36_ACOCL|nr:hypothetical protein QJS10_CPB17g01043 [Acorus calamus]
MEGTKTSTKTKMSIGNSLSVAQDAIHAENHDRGFDFLHSRAASASGCGGGRSRGLGRRDEEKIRFGRCDVQRGRPMRAWPNENAAPEILHLQAAMVWRDGEQIQLLAIDVQ